MVAIRTFDIGDTMLKAGAIRKQRMESELMGKALETAESDYELQRAGAFNAFVTGALPKVQLGDYRDFYDHLKTMGNPEVLGIPTPDKAEKMTPAAWSEYKYGKIKKEEKKTSFQEKNYEEWKQANPDGTRMDFMAAQSEAGRSPKSESKYGVAQKIDDTRGYYSSASKHLLDPDTGLVRSGKEDAYASLNAKMTADMKAIYKGEDPEWLTSKEEEELPDGLTEETIEYNMTTYGKTREEVISKYRGK